MERTADGIVEMAFGGSPVTRERESDALISISDDLKAAATDPMKKCATFLGVVLHLYTEKPLPGAGPLRAGRLRLPNPLTPPQAGGSEGTRVKSGSRAWN